MFPVQKRDLRRAARADATQEREESTGPRRRTAKTATARAGDSKICRELRSRPNCSAPVGMIALVCAHSGARFGTASRLCLPGYGWPFVMRHSFAASSGPLTAVLNGSLIPPLFRTHCAGSATRRRLILLCSYS